MQNDPTKLRRNPRVDEAIAHLSSVAAVCRAKRTARVIPFPARERQR